MLRGNFPPVSPWAPDLAATYHYGPSLAAVGLHVLSGLDFVLLFELLGAAAQAAVLVLIAPSTSGAFRTVSGWRCPLWCCCSGAVPKSSARCRGW